eukprot:m.253706 g.253706  ORF g.253706 m.253706 type:complete len:442 (-) comp16162_c0_seq10:48-1373(-)
MKVYILFFILAIGLAYGNVVPKIEQVKATDHLTSLDDAYKQATFTIHHECVKLSISQNQISVPQRNVTEKDCYRVCASGAYTVFGLVNDFKTKNKLCWCADEFLEHKLPSNFESCEKTVGSQDGVSTVGKITSKMPMIVYVYRLSTNERAPGMLGIKSEFEEKYFRQFALRWMPWERDYTLEAPTQAKPTEVIRKADARQLYEKYCANGKNKDLKLIILSETGALRHPRSVRLNLLANWPSRSVLFVGQNEYLSVPFGTTFNNEFGVVEGAMGKVTRRYGQRHSGNMANLPKEVRPFFQQYYCKSLEETGEQDNWMHRIPLWLRHEFVEAEGSSQFTKSSQRKLAYSYMAALTSTDRTKCHDALVNETFFPKEKKFIHVATNWQGDPNTGEYVHAMEYKEYLAQSVFTLAPAGHSPDQYRIYEAAYSGCIPVMSSATLGNM